MATVKTKAASKKKATSKKAAPEKKASISKANGTSRVVENQYGKGGKSAIVRKMVETGKNRKQILDKLESLNPDIPRKTNAGLVSVILKQLGKRGISSGVVNGSRKKTIKVSSKK